MKFHSVHHPDKVKRRMQMLLIVIELERHVNSFRGKTEKQKDQILQVLLASQRIIWLASFEKEQQESYRPDQTRPGQSLAGLEYRTGDLEIKT